MSAKSIKKALSCILIAAMVTSVCNTTGVTAAKKAVLKTKRIVVEVGSSKKIVIKNKDKKKKYTFKSNKKKIAKALEKLEINDVIIPCRILNDRQCGRFPCAPLCTRVQGL